MELEQYLKQIGRELTSIRSREGINLEEAGKITKTHKNTLSSYENNPESLKLGKLLDLLSSYNIDPLIFFTNVCEYIRNSQKTE